MKKIILIFFAFSSCTDKKLKEQKFRIGDLEISRYQISLITSAHDHIDVKKEGKSEHILKINTNTIDSVFVLSDTLIIKTYLHPVIYEKKDKVFSYFIKIDSSSIKQ